jgi:hypothetical protein
LWSIFGKFSETGHVSARLIAARAAASSLLLLRAARAAESVLKMQLEVKKVGQNTKKWSKYWSGQTEKRERDREGK